MQVMAGIAGDKVNWTGVPNVASYISTATDSLLQYYEKFQLAGFDLNYEKGLGISDLDTSDTSWVDAWCVIVHNLKQVYDG